MKNILLISTGGTISCKKTPNGLTPTLSAQELIDEVKDIKQICNATGVDLMRIDSTNMLPEDWKTIKDCIEKNYNDYDGFVITHGTDTLVYTASMLSYLIQGGNKPICITGAQKPILAESSDALNNLVDSFLYATTNNAGVFIIFDGKVIAGTRGKKVRTKSFNAFQSMNYPDLAHIIDKRIFEFIKTDYSPVKFYNDINSSVGLLTLTPGLKHDIIEAYLKTFDCVVVSSFGTGGIPDNNEHYLSIIEKYARLGKIIVLATQVSQEGSDMSIYQVAINTKNRIRFIEAYDMNIFAVITKMMWILAITKDFEEIEKYFYQTINYDILYKGN